MTEHVRTEVLVIGGGGAGFRAAIAARHSGARVLLLSKGPLGRCGATPMAGADFTLDGRSMHELGRDGDLNDSREKVFNDIVTQGYYLNNQKLAEHYVHTAPLLLRDLLDWGLKIMLSDQRAVITSGLHIMDVLLRKARSVGVEMREDIMALDLITNGGAIAGVLALDVRSGEFIRIAASAVVITTGGWHKAYWPNTGMRDLSGDGIAMAHRAGALIGNMEFVTFACNIMLDPPMWRGSLAPYVLSLVCGGSLTNNCGEEILAPYDPVVVKTGTTTEWNKSFVSHATAREVRLGKGFRNGGVHYSRGDVSWEVIKLVASITFPGWKYKAMDLTEWGRMLEANEPVEVGPAVEYFDGGIVVNERFETAIPGLFAAGECCLGPFGANRIFSAITEILVQGRDAGEHAAHYALTEGGAQPPIAGFEALEKKALLPLARNNEVRPAFLRRELQLRAQRHLGPIRNKNELEEFIIYLRGMKQNHLPHLGTASSGRVYNKEWIDCLELGDLVHLLEASARCALARTESRGVHFREDFPVCDNDRWLVESIVEYAEGDPKVCTRPVTATTMSPPGGKMPYLDMMKKMMQSHSDTGGMH